LAVLHLDVAQLGVLTANWQPWADGPCGWAGGTNHPDLCGLMANDPNRHQANHCIAFIDIPKCFDDGQKKVTFLLRS